MKARLREMLAGVSPVPLGVLFGLNFVDEFDRFAFAALAPEIQEAFNLSDDGIGAVATVAAVFGLLAAVPMGIMADRLPRLRLATIAAIMWGVAAALTGVVTTVALLVVVRLFSGVGRTANEVVHPSLLTDYYPTRAHPRVFQLHRMANPTSAISGVAAGGIAAAFSWQWAFIVLAIPTFVFLAALTRLREPERGRSDRLDDAIARGEDPDEIEILDGVGDLAIGTDGAGSHVKFKDAVRSLVAIRTMRRFWLAAVFLGIPFINIAVFISLYYENVFELEKLGRGTVQAVHGFGLASGMSLGGIIAARELVNHNHDRLAVIGGFGFVGFGIGLGAMAASPNAWVAGFFTFAMSIGIGTYQPAYFTAVALVVPAEIRAQAYALTVLVLGIGAIFSIPIFTLADNVGYRQAFVVLAGFAVLAGLLTASAGRYVFDDLRRPAERV